MTVRAVDVIDPGSLFPGEVQARLDGDRVRLAQDDYYESGGICYSQVILDRADIEQLLALFDAKRQS